MPTWTTSRESQDYLSAVEKLEASLRFLDAHFGGIDSPRGTRERSRTRDS